MKSFLFLTLDDHGIPIRDNYFTIEDVPDAPVLTPTLKKLKMKSFLFLTLDDHGIPIRDNYFTIEDIPDDVLRLRPLTGDRDIPDDGLRLRPLTGDRDIPDDVLRNSLPIELNFYIFNEFLNIESNASHNILKNGNIRHIRNALYNHCVIDHCIRRKSDMHSNNHWKSLKTSIKWGRIYEYTRKKIRKLCNKNPNLSNIFVEIVRNSKIRSDNVNKIRIGTIITVHTAEGLIRYYFVDAMKKGAVLGVHIEIIHNLEIKNSDGITVSTSDNVILLSNTQCWLENK